MQVVNHKDANGSRDIRNRDAGATRWRLFPAAISFLVGLASFAFGVFAVAVMTYVLLTENTEETLGGMLVGCFLYLGFGTAWMLAGRLYWRRRYPHALLANAVGVAIPITLFATLGF